MQLAARSDLLSRVSSQEVSVLTLPPANRNVPKFSASTQDTSLLKSRLQFPKNRQQEHRASTYDWQLQNARSQCVGTIATLNTAFAPNLENVGEPLHYFFNPYSSFIRTRRVINHSNFNSFQTNLGPTRINSKSRLFMLCLLFSEILCCK